VLLASRGVSVRTTAKELGISVATAALWRRRYLEGGVQALVHDAPGRGRKSSWSLETVRPILATYGAKKGAASVRQLAATLGMSKSTVHRLLRRPGLGPGRDDLKS
jgi:transposase